MNNKILEWFKIKIFSEELNLLGEKLQRSNSDIEEIRSTLNDVRELLRQMEDHDLHLDEGLDNESSLD